MSQTNFLGNWHYPTTIKFGPGRISELAEHCKSQGINSPLLVTDEQLVALDIVTNAKKHCQDAGLSITVYSSVQANPNGKNVNEGVEAYKLSKSDGVIAIGGGSALDAAKAIALMIAQDRPIWDFEDVGDNWLRVNTEGIAPLIAIPTTSGTGSEVGRVSVILDESASAKKLIFHPKMMPPLVIADPELTFGLPPHITAATGVDAFVHSFEAYCSPGFHPMADGIALQSMALVQNSLVRAFSNPTDVQARSEMMAASTMGAAAFQKGLGAVHALAHPLGAFYGKHHGLLNAILLPYVLLANRAAIEEKVILLSRFLALDSHSFEGFFDWVVNLRIDLNIPNSLSEIGIDESDVEELAARALQDPSAAGNPLPFSVGDYQRVLRAAISGELC